MNEIGLAVDPRFIVEGNHTLEGGGRTFAKLLKINPLPTAVLCSNDMTAIGVMRKSLPEKIEVPREISIIGFDNIRFSQYILPPLSTIEMSQAEAAKLAFHALLNDVRDGNAKSERHRVHSANQFRLAKFDGTEPEARTGTSKHDYRHLVW